MIIFEHVYCFFFFFQAEDGIRDLTVTGVQTCALPISTRWVRDLRSVELRRPCRLQSRQRNDQKSPRGHGKQPAATSARRPDREPETEIGRASCRERV